MILGYVTDIFRTMLDGFSQSHWKGQEKNSSVMFDITEALVAVADFDSAKNLRQVPFNLFIAIYMNPSKLVPICLIIFN